MVASAASAERGVAVSESKGDLGELLRQYGLPFIERGVWLVVGQSSRDYGWKLHLSSVQALVPELLRRVLPILSERSVHFKIARDLTVLGMLNEGALGDTQVGKFATLYPADTRSARTLARELIAATEGLHGPRIVTDRHLGAVVYTRYGPISPEMRRNRLGLFEPADAAKGNAAAYRVPFTLLEGLEDPFFDFPVVPDDAPADTAVRPLGPGYLVTSVISRHAKGCVYEAIDLRDRFNVRTVVLKQGHWHCMSDMQGRAMEERIANQARAHARAASFGVTPVAHEPFDFCGSTFLPLEFVPGRDLGARPATPYRRLPPAAARTLLFTLAAAGDALQALHRARVIHRDLSMRNIRVGDDGRVYLLDLEIAHVLPTAASSGTGEIAGANPPFMQGTPGFVSPQQLAGGAASIGDDVYAFAAVLICALSGLDPQRVTFAQAGMDRHARATQISELSGAPSQLCDAIAAAISPHADERPPLDTLIASLRAAVDAPASILAAGTTARAVDVQQLATLGARWLVEGAARDERTRMWKSPDIESTVHADIRLVHAFRVYRSANVGVAGVTYAISKLCRFGFDVGGAAEHVAGSIDWLLDHQPTPDDQLPGLHFGEMGVAVAIAEALRAGLIAHGDWVSPYFHEVFDAPIDWPDLTHGAAGQGLGALTCAALLPETCGLGPAIERCVERCARFLCATQRDDGAWVLPEGVSEMSGKAFTGFAHGAAGALAFLSHPFVFASGAAVRDAARRAAHWLLDEARAGEGGLSLFWHMAPEEPRAWSWWCHGGPGIAIGLLAYHRATGEARFAAAARAALRGQPFEPRHANLGQCHGIAGIGEIYLDAHALLQEPEWLDRALAVGQVLSNLARIDAQGASWLVENPYVPTPDLMIGTAGIVHFLARLARRQPDFAAPLRPPLLPDGPALRSATR